MAADGLPTISFSHMTGNGQFEYASQTIKQQLSRWVFVRNHTQYESDRC